LSAGHQYEGERNRYQETQLAAAITLFYRGINRADGLRLRPLPDKLK